MSPRTKQGSERVRDEQRDGGPRYGGEAWKVADERGDNRFGKARNDDADPSELLKAGEDQANELAGEAEGDELTVGELENASDVDDQVIESSGEMAGMGRGEKPRKPKSRSRK